MYSVQKQDFMGNWVEVCRAQKWDDANNFRKGSSLKMRIVHV